MATPVTTKVQEDIDWYMGALEREWRSAVELAANWDDADPFDKEDLAIEWDLTIDFLLRVLNYQERGLLSAEQQQRFADIRQYMLDHESDIDAVLGPGEATIDPPREWYVNLHQKR
jgi:hypothetical protein